MGEVVDLADDFQGRVTTATHPFKVRFELDPAPGKKKKRKVFAHLVSSSMPPPTIKATHSITERKMFTDHPPKRLFLLSQARLTDDAPLSSSLSLSAVLCFASSTDQIRD